MKAVGIVSVRPYRKSKRKDGRRHNGGARNGAGRKPKSQVAKALEIFNKIVTDADMEEIIKKAMEQAKDGDRHARLFLADRLYGKPPETVHTIDETPLMIVDE